MNLPTTKTAMFLSTKLFETSILYFDYWSIVHFFTAIVLAFYVKSWWKVLSLLMIWEILEFAIILKAPEPSLDIIWDLIIGMLGYTLVYYLRRRKEKAIKVGYIHENRAY